MCPARDTFLYFKYGLRVQKVSDHCYSIIIASQNKNKPLIYRRIIIVYIFYGSAQIVTLLDFIFGHRIKLFYTALRLYYIRVYQVEKQKIRIKPTCKHQTLPRRNLNNPVLYIYIRTRFGYHVLPPYHTTHKTNVAKNTETFGDTPCITGL